MKYRFAHHRLDAYRLASELADHVNELAPQIPLGGGGKKELRPQIVDAANSCPALIAEGANRWTSKQKRQRFIEARGEAGEVASHLERCHRRSFISEQQLERGLELADRVCATLTGLIKRHS